MITVVWNIIESDNSVVTTKENLKFPIDVEKTWKGTKIRGHDIAEFIANDVWADEDGLVIKKLRIETPEEYAGTYEVVADFEPTFTAKKV